MQAFSMNVLPFFQWLLKTSLQGSLLICLILLVKSVLRGRLPIRWHYYLWFLLLVRLAMPWAPQSRISIFNLVPQYSSPGRVEAVSENDNADDAEAHTTAKSLSTQETTQYPAVADKQGTEQPKPATIPTVVDSGAAFSDTDASTQSVAGRLVRILPLVWLIGAAGLGGYVAVRNFSLWRTIKRERPVTDQEILDLLEDCKMQMRVETIVGVVVTDRVKSPALFGFVRPRLLLPQGLIEALDLEELHYVFLHELAHLKRRDIYLGWLVSLLQVMHWFNPLIWFALRRMRTDQELACDGLVLSTMATDEPPKYGRTIVNLFERFSQVTYMPSIAGILEDKSQLERRIKMIARFKKNSYQWSPLAVVLIIVLGCVSLPDAKRKKPSEASAAKLAHQPNFRKIWIPTKPGNGALSPDGKKLAFVSEGSLWVVPVHGKVSPDIAGEPVRLTEPMGAWDLASFIAWSADGNWIGFNVSDEKEDAIYVVRSSGGVPKKVPVEPRLRNSVFNYRLSLSPDGKVLAFSSRYIQKSEAEPPEEPGGLPPAVRGFFIYTVTVAGGEVKRLTDSASGEPAFSPDGKKIAFVKYYTSEKGQLCGSLWVLPAAGGSPIQVSHSDPRGRVGGPIWSPDGKMIAFTSKALSEKGLSERKEICIVPVSETGKALASPTKIELPLGTYDMLAGWTPDNKVGVFLHNPDPWAIYTISASGGKPVQITPSGWATHPQWSPDGERIYFRWNYGIASVPSHGGELSIVRDHRDSTFNLVYPGSGNAVSPDGKEIVFCDYGNIHTIPIDGGEPKQITQGRFPCWSPDGKSIAFIRSAFVRSHEDSKGEYVWNIYIIPSKGGDVRKLTSESDDVRRKHIDWSPDGKLIAYFAEDKKTIRVIPVQGGEPRVVVKVEEVRNYDELAWSPDGTKLVYSSKGSIWIVSSDGGEPEEIETGFDAKAGHVSWSPDGKKLAFTAIKGGEEELWLMENFLPGTPVAKPARQTTLRQVWAGGESPWDGKISPDGRYFSFVDWGENARDLAILELATGKIRRLTNMGDESEKYEYAFFSRWSPDGKQIVYEYEGDFSELRIIGLDGSKPRILYRDEEGGYVRPHDWSPDGKQVLAFLGREGTNQIVLISVEDGSMRVLKTITHGEHPYHWSFSPDGRYIVYESPQAEDSPESDIFLFSVDEKREVPIVEHPANDKVFGWAPDSDWLLFVSDRTESWDAWAISVAEGKPKGNPELIKKGIGNIYPMGFTQNGAFYYTDSKQMEDIYTVAMNPETGKIDSPPNKLPILGLGGNDSPQYSPDGKCLAYTRNSSLCILSLETSKVRKFPLKLNARHLRWSPDRQYILFNSIDVNRRKGIYRLEVQTGNIIPISLPKKEYNIDYGYSIHFNEWSHDGKSFFYVEYDRKNKLCKILNRDFETGNEKELYQGHKYFRISLSPDGQWLAFTCKEVEGEIKVMPASGGEPRELCKRVQPSGSAPPLAWPADGRYVLFSTFQEDAWRSNLWLSNLWRVPIEGGEPQKLGLEMIQISDLSVHPDGQHIAFQSSGFSVESGEVWVMENFLPAAVASAGE